jgi:hypothetical protein
MEEREKCFLLFGPGHHTRIMHFMYRMVKQSPSDGSLCQVRVLLVQKDTSMDFVKVAFYEIHGRKGEVLLFSSVPDTTPDLGILCTNKKYLKVITIVTKLSLLSAYVPSESSLLYNIQVSI